MARAGGLRRPTEARDQTSEPRMNVPFAHYKKVTLVSKTLKSENPKFVTQNRTREKESLFRHRAASITRLHCTALHCTAFLQRADLISKSSSSLVEYKHNNTRPAFPRILHTNPPVPHRSRFPRCPRPAPQSKGSWTPATTGRIQTCSSASRLACS